MNTQAAVGQVKTEQEIDALLIKWKHAKEQLAYYATVELELRMQLANDPQLFDPNVQKGTLNYQLPMGYKLKLERKENTKVENSNGECFHALDVFSELGESQKRMAKDLFRFDANLRQTEFDKLSDEEKKLFYPIITTKPATPSLTLVVPKAS